MIFLLFLILLMGYWFSVSELSIHEHKREISVIRYDRLQSEYVRFNSMSALQKMNTIYGRPTRILVEDMLGIGNVSDTDINDIYKEYFSDTTLLRLMNDVESKFEDLAPIEEKLTRGFEQLRKELPLLLTPKVYAQISAFNESIVVADSLIGISLDKYMGEDYPLYGRFYYPYQCRSMRPDRIVPDCFLYYLSGTYPLPPLKKRTLLEYMIRNGQLYYVIQQVLDYQSVADAIGYSEPEKRWWKENRAEVWEYLILNKMLSSTDPMVIRRFMYPVPSTSFFGENSPAFIGACMGAEIIASYMKENKKITLEELLHTENYVLLLEDSKYQINRKP